VIRNLNIIGEAVKNLSPETRDRCPEIAWRQISGMRDVLIHEYFGVRVETVWNVVENRLPEQLESMVRNLIDPGPGVGLSGFTYCG